MPSRERSQSTSRKRQERARAYTQLAAIAIIAVILVTAVTIVYVLPVLFGKNATLYGTIVVKDQYGNIVSLNSSSPVVLQPNGSITDNVAIGFNASVSAGANATLSWTAHCTLEATFDGTVVATYPCGEYGAYYIPAKIPIGSISVTGQQLISILSQHSGLVANSTHTIAFLTTGGNMTVTFSDCSQCGETVHWHSTTLDTLTITIG